MAKTQSGDLDGYTGVESDRCVSGSEIVQPTSARDAVIPMTYRIAGIGALDYEDRSTCYLDFHADATDPLGQWAPGHTAGHERAVGGVPREDMDAVDG